MAETLQPPRRVVPDDASNAQTRLVPRRIRSAEILAFVGLVAAFLAAMGPAERVRTAYSWPPAERSAQTPSRLWYTPLLLSARVPESISVKLPCSPSAVLLQASSPPVVLATTRRTAGNSGLTVMQRTSQLIVRIGDRRLAAVPLMSGAPGDCSYRLLMTNGRWSLEGGPDEVALTGELHFMPEVNGLFSEADLDTTPAPEVTVTTEAHATDATTSQTILRVLAAVSVVLALILVGAVGTRGRRNAPLVRSALNRLRSSIRWVDAVVIGSLAGWWVLAPAHWDDGWVVARQAGFSSAGGFSNYYDSFGANLPNGYWLEWMQHWVTQSSNAVLVLRVPALLSLVATWLVSRWVVSRILGAQSRTGVVTWALATAFLAAALAWGMTLRPEPFTALLVCAALACAVAFATAESTAALTLAVGLVPIAMTGHHAGLLAAAPLLAIGSQLISWTRRNPAAATALVTSGFALLLLLAFLGADVAQRSLDAQAISAYGVPDAWFDELRRYARLSDFHGGPPLRRASFALMALAVVAFLARRRATRHGILDLPGRALLIGFVLLIAVPSKWPWHFGVLTGISAVAVTVETYRIRSEGRPRAWEARWVVAVLAATVAIAWSWGPRQSWTLLDLSTLDWTPDTPVSAISSALPALLVIAIVIASRARGRSGSDAPWRVTCAAAPILILPAIVFTVSVLSVDAARSDWTLSRQNLGSLRGAAGCGLADTLVVPREASMKPTRALTGMPTQGVPGWLPEGPVEGLPRYALVPARGGVASSPWFVLPQRGFGFFVAGGSVGQTLELAWGESQSDRVTPISTHVVADDVVATPGAAPWRFVAAGELGRRPTRADAVRLTVRALAPLTAPVGVSAPVTYRNQSLSELLAEPGSTALVSPAFRTYMPCARLPKLGDGLVEAPSYIVSPDGQWLPDPELAVGYRTSPFRGVTDLYDVERVSIADSRSRPPLTVWRVDTEIPGASLAHPASTRG